MIYIIPSEEGVNTIIDEKLFSGLICSLFLPSPRHIVKHHITTQYQLLFTQSKSEFKDQLTVRKAGTILGTVPELASRNLI